MSNYLARSQVARELGVSAESVSVWMRQGKIAFIATPLGRLVSRDEVERIKKQREAHEERSCAMSA